MPQAIECLLCKHQALSSNTSPTKKKKKKNVIVLMIFTESTRGTQAHVNPRKGLPATPLISHLP
jgi:hypothetical protein